MIFENVFSIPPRQPNLGRRLGLIRSQGPFEHPILLGLFCSLGVANVFYIYKGKLVQQFWRTAFLVFLTFTTLSSAPLIAVGLQLMICTYDRILQFIKGRWVLLAALALTGLGLLKVASQFEIVDFIINNLTFNPVTGEARIEVFTYGIIEVWRHPVFGIGNNDWVRPYWHAHPSVDNFWLAMTMRYGIPTFFCFVAGILSSFYLITSANGLSETEGRYRTGYLIALVGLIVVLGTVSMWGATSVFVMAYLGAGNWFHNSGGPASSRPQRVRDRPLTTTSRREAPVQKTATIAPPHRRTMNSLRQTRRGS